MEFKDYFSRQAEYYARYRPKYPKELFIFLASLVKEHKLAWDAATGNGQSATALASHFNKVIATDASESQLKYAVQHENIEYMIATAEDSGLENHSIDLITVATAIHWLNTEKFYAEVKRVLKPGGVIAVWVYDNSRITPEVDKIIKKYSTEILDKHWPIENAKAWNFKTEIQLPFEKIECPEFQIEVKWSLREYINYLYTWSSTQNYIKKHGVNPLDDLYELLLALWGDENEKKLITMPLEIKAGRA